MDQVTFYTILSMALFSIGAVGVFARRNTIIVFMCIELMLNACNLAFVNFANYHASIDPQVYVFFVMAIAACEACIGLAIIISVYRHYRSVNINTPSTLFS